MKEKDLLKRRALAVLAANLAAVSGYALLAYALDASTDDYVKALKDHEFARRKEEELISLKKELQSLDTQKRFVDSLFVVKEDVPRFVERIEETGTQAGVAVSINSLQTKPFAGKEALFAEYTAEGSFAGLKDQLRLLDELPFIVDVLSVRLDEGEASWRQTVSLVLRSYSAK